MNKLAADVGTIFNLDGNVLNFDTANITGTLTAERIDSNVVNIKTLWRGSRQLDSDASTTLVFYEDSAEYQTLEVVVSFVSSGSGTIRRYYDLLTCPEDATSSASTVSIPNGQTDNYILTVNNHLSVTIIKEAHPDDLDLEISHIYAVKRDSVL